MIPISDDNPVRSTSYVTITLIALCVLAFVWELSLGGKADGALAVLGFTPDTLIHPENAFSPWLGIPPVATILT
jgi:membrane associated rhomboid family serine protease